MGIRYDDILMTIDVRKGRLRIYKSTLHRLNDPKAIQLLVNPASKVIAVRSADDLDSRRHTLSVARFLAPGGGDVDLYCYYLVRDMQAAFPEIAEGYSYRLHGFLQEKDNMVCFPISSLDEIKKIGAAEENDG